MIRVELDHLICCNPQQFWSGFFNLPTITSFYTQAIGFTRFAVLRQVEDDTSIIRDVDCQLPVALSRPLQAIFRGGFRFVERGRFDRSDALWRFLWAPSALTSRFRFDGQMRVVEVGEASAGSRRLVQIDVEARVPGLSGLVEQTAEKLLRETWDRSAVELNNWLARLIWA